MLIHHKYPIGILNKHKLPKVAYRPRRYVGRGSVLGNPFTVEEYGRGHACQKYKEYLKNEIAKGNEAILNALEDIAQEAIKGGVDLVCFCNVPQQSCHARTIRAVIYCQMVENINTNDKAPCKCRSGHASGYDGICLHCRTKSQRKLLATLQAELHIFTDPTVDLTLNEPYPDIDRRY